MRLLRDTGFCVIIIRRNGSVGSIRSIGSIHIESNLALESHQVVGVIGPVTLVNGNLQVCVKESAGPRADGRKAFKDAKTSDAKMTFQVGIWERQVVSQEGGNGRKDGSIILKEPLIVPLEVDATFFGIPEGAQDSVGRGKLGEVG